MAMNCVEEKLTQGPSLLFGRLPIHAKSGRPPRQAKSAPVGGPGREWDPNAASLTEFGMTNIFLPDTCVYRGFKFVFTNVVGSVSSDYPLATLAITPRAKGARQTRTSSA